MKRGPRIALEVFGPPLVATLLAYSGALAASIVQGGGHAMGLAPTLREIGVVIAVAYVTAGIPSLLYAACMEWAFARGLPPYSWRTVWLSMLLGFAAGIALLGFLFWRASNHPVPWLILMAVGLATGTVLGLVIKQLSRPKAG